MEGPSLDQFVATWDRRRASCAEFWLAVPQPGQVPLLLEILARYRSCRQAACCDLRESFALNELTAAYYAHRPRPSECESLQILHTAFHTCGHGSDVKPPFDFALRHFRQKPYSPKLHDALRAYRETLSHAHGVVAQQLKGRIDLILWQDLRHTELWKQCWTARIHRDLQAMSPAARKYWTALFQSFQHCLQIEPTKQWLAAAGQPLAALTGETFRHQVGRWLEEPAAAVKPQLSTPGSHILKNLIWCAVSVNDATLDRQFPNLLAIPWKNTQPSEKVAGSMAYLFSRRDPQSSLAYLEPIARKYGFPGGKIEEYFRAARSIKSAGR